jgi:hypothetical protein
MCVPRVANTGLPVLTFFLAARGMLNGMHGRRVVAAMVLLHAAEMAALLTAVTVTGGLARSHPGRGMGSAMLLPLVATLLVGWQGYRWTGHTSRCQRRGVGVADCCGGPGCAQRAQPHLVRTGDSCRDLHPPRAAFRAAPPPSAAPGVAYRPGALSGQRCRVEGRAGRLGGRGGQRVARVRARIAASGYCGESGFARSLSGPLRVDVCWRRLQDGVALLRRITRAHRVAVGFGGAVRPEWVRSPSWVHASCACRGRRGGQPGSHQSGSEGCGHVSLRHLVLYRRGDMNSIINVRRWVVEGQAPRV